VKHLFGDEETQSMSAVKYIKCELRNDNEKI